MIVRLLSTAMLMFVLLGNPLRAQVPLQEPRGEPILQVTGMLDRTNAPSGAVFDRDMLEALGSASITTKTPWYPGTVRFEGVPMHKVLEAVGARGSVVRAVALNDYVVTIPVEDFANHGVIIALKRDGQYMPVRDKGPLFIIYPYDSNPELQSQLYYARSAWQLKRLEVLP